MYQWAHTVYHEFKSLGKNFFYIAIISVNPWVSQQPTIYKLICTLTPEEEFRASVNSHAFLEDNWSHKSWILACLCTVPFWEKDFVHWGYLYGLSPLWMLKCVGKTPIVTEDFVHKHIDRVSHQSEILHVSASHAAEETLKYTRSTYTVSHHCVLCNVS